MTDKRRGFRFGMKLLLLVMTAASLVLATIANPLAEQRRQRALLDQAATRGGRISLVASHAREPSLGRFLLARFDGTYARLNSYRIDFAGVELHDDDLEQLASIRYIRELDLSDTRITDAGLHHLKNQEMLAHLDLSRTQVTDQGVAQLSTIEKLAFLQVSGTQVSYAALEQLDAELPYANFCEQKAIADLKAKGIQVVDPAHFVEMPEDGWIFSAGTKAVAVVIGMTQAARLTPGDVRRLGYLQSLRAATFHTVSLGPKGLIELPPLKDLENLDFWFTNLTDRDLECLSRQAQLESLTIHDADDITDDGLARLGALNNLRKLRVSACQGITKKAMDALAQQLPDCRCTYSMY